MVDYWNSKWISNKLATNPFCKLDHAWLFLRLGDDILEECHWSAVSWIMAFSMLTCNLFLIFVFSPNGRCLNKQLDLTWCWCEECTELVALLVFISWFSCLQLDLIFEIAPYPLKWWQTYFISCCFYSCSYIRSLITYSHLTHSHLHFWIMIASMDICVSPKITPPVSWFRFYQNVLFIPKYLAKQFNVCHTSFYWPFALIKVKVKNSDCGTFKEEW